jgi:hypothetical protein
MGVVTVFYAAFFFLGVGESAICGALSAASGGGMRDGWWCLELILWLVSRLVVVVGWIGGRWEDERVGQKGREGKGRRE